MPAGSPRAAQGCLQCGGGWRELLEHALSKIEAVIAEGGRFQMQQIREKSGCLRFYWSSRRLSVGAETRVKEAIDLAEARSACTCEICGEEGRPYRSGGWLITRCAAHAKGSCSMSSRALRTCTSWNDASETAPEPSLSAPTTAPPTALSTSYPPQCGSRSSCMARLC
jgi:hypothetical protein